MNRAYFTNLQIGYRLNKNLIKYRKIAKTGKCCIDKYSMLC